MTEQGKRHPVDMLANGTRQVMIEPVYEKDEFNNFIFQAMDDGRMRPRVIGLAFHQHMEDTFISEDGIETGGCCDYVVMDMGQIMALKELLNSAEIKDKDGNGYNDRG